MTYRNSADSNAANDNSLVVKRLNFGEKKMSALATLESDEETDTVEEVAEMNESFEDAAVEDVVEDEVVDLGLKTRKRKHQGLGISKPPKKKPRLPVPIVQPSVPTSSSSAPRKQVRKKNQLPS
jgi:hypothetical protein